jgi:hypothetical protein
MLTEAYWHALERAPVVPRFRFRSIPASSQNGALLQLLEGRDAYAGQRLRKTRLRQNGGGLEAAGTGSAPQL